MTPPPKEKPLLPPDLPASLEDADGITDEMRELLYDRDDIEAVCFTGAAIEGLSAPRLSFRGCMFDKCTFAPAEAGTFDFTDCVFRGCDFSAMRFDEASFLRVLFAKCRGVGAYFTDATMRHATFDDCRMDYVNFGMAKLTSVALRACDMSHASLGYAQIKDVRIEDSRLSGAELFGTRFSGMDLRTDDIDGIVLGDRRELEGAKVTPMQASVLALLLGVVIE